MNPLIPASLALGLALAGCKVPSTTPTPALDAPAAFSQGDSAPAPGLETRAWWRSFNDPTLDGLMARAVQGNLSVQQAQARILQARASLGGARADFYPTVTADAGVTRAKTSQNATASGAPTHPSTLYQAGFDASWEMDTFGGKGLARDAAQARLEASVADLGAVLLTLQGDVATSYISLRGNQALLEIARNNAEAQRQTVEVTEARFRLGLITSLDVAQAKAQLATTNSSLPTYEAAIQQSIHRLGTLLGLAPTALSAELSPVQPLPSAQGLISTGLPSELLARRPDLRQSERNLAAAMADIGVAKAELYPKFDLTLGLGLQSLQSGTFTQAASRYWSIIPGLSLPIFNRGRLKAEVARKQSVYQEQVAAFRAAYHSALEDVENALTTYYSENARRQALQDSVHYNQDALGLAQDRYKRGLTTFLDVLTVQTALLNAQNSLSQSEAKLLTDLVALNKALGGGWKAS